MGPTVVVVHEHELLDEVVEQVLQLGVGLQHQRAQLRRRAAPQLLREEDQQVAQARVRLHTHKVSGCSRSIASSFYCLTRAIETKVIRSRLISSFFGKKCIFF